MKNKFSKLIKILMIAILFLQNISNVVIAATEISKANLKNDHKITTNIEFTHEDGTWHTVVCNYICYTNKGKKHPAYCIKHGVDGVDENGSYTVKISKLLSDEKIWRTIINGYPYKTPKQIGVETADDAYVATKQAINSVMLNRDVRKFYRGTNSKGKKIVDAIYNLSEIGKHGTQTMKDPNINVNKLSNLTKYNDDWYYQEYSVNSDIDISSYTVTKLENFPKEAYISDENGNGKYIFNSGEKFRIMMKKENINTDIVGSITVEGKCKSYPIFFGEAPNSKLQDYAITYDAYGDFDITKKFIENTDTAKIKIIKKDEDTLKPIKGVKYQLSKESGEIISAKATDEKGIIEFDNLYTGNYILQEIATNNDYVLDNTKHKITAGFNDVITREYTNKHKKGSLKIIKVDKDDHDITLGGIEFDLIDSSNNIIAHLVTGADGEAFIENVNIGNYTLKETKTKKEYNLCIDEDILVKWNETSSITIENEKKKGQIKVIKEDKDYNQIKLAGVEFEVLDKNNRIIEKIVTDKNGEAITSRLPIGEYKLKETSLGTNNSYIMNDEIIVVKVENDKTTQLHIQNEHKKGMLKIVKVDSDNNELPVEDVKFEITDEDNFKYYATTDKNGIIEIPNIRTGKVKIKELETKEEYVLSKEEYHKEIQYNKTSEITIKNEKKKGKIEVYKTDEENNEIKLPGVEFEILDINDNVIDKIITNDKGYAITKRLTIGEYYLKETKTDKKYILKEEKIKVNVKYDEVSTLNITNKKIKGRIKVIKTSSSDSPLLNIKKGDSVSNITFGIYNMKNELVDQILTNEKGEAISKELEFGRYRIKELETTNHYILNTNEFFVNIENNNEVNIINIENDPVIPRLDIEKFGQDEAYENDEIKYDFNIKNAGNTFLDNFTWIDYIPYEKVELTKMITGLYNGNLNYKISYKTNKNDYQLFKEINTTKSEYLDFSQIELSKNEKITELKIEYGTVPVGFKSIISPSIFIKVEKCIKADDTIVNRTELLGNYYESNLKDEAECKTIIKERIIEKKLPRTGK